MMIKISLIVFAIICTVAIIKAIVIIKRETTEEIKQFEQIKSQAEQALARMESDEQ